MKKDSDSSLRKLLSEISGHTIGDDDYMAYFVNSYGEQLVYVKKPGSRAGVLLHSDLDWEPKPVEGPPRRGADRPGLSPVARVFMGDVPVVGDVILNHTEAWWLRACVAAADEW